MGLDAWGVKLKPGVPMHLVSWDSIEDLDEADLLPQCNYFYNHAYTRIHQSFINYVIKEMNSSLKFTGNPCCSSDDMDKVSTLLICYLKDNQKDVYSWMDDEGNKKILSGKEINDLCEYLEILNKNGFVMWFSF